MLAGKIATTALSSPRDSDGMLPVPQEEREEAEAA